MTGTIISCHQVRLRRDGVTILGGIDWTVRPGEQWVVLGRNGSGKTSLVRIAAFDLHPTSGEVTLGDVRLGEGDVRAMRRRVGFVSASLAAEVRASIPCSELVMSARRGAREVWWHTYDETDRHATRRALDRFGVGHLADRSFARASTGERQRVLLARALVDEPDLLVLDEPTAGLDLAGREQFVADLESLGPTDPPAVLVTHHLDEIPATATHALLLADGAVISDGPITDAITDGTLSECFGMALRVTRHRGRWSAYRSA